MVRQVPVVIVLLLLSPLPLYAQDAVFTVTNASADVHSGPTIASPVIGKALRGQAFDVTRNLGSWVRVPWPDAPDGIGYLHVTWGTLSGESRPSALVASESTPAALPGVERQKSGTDGPASTNTTKPSPVLISLPSHAVGVGGQIGRRPSGLGATARGWSRNRLGLQIEIGRSMRTAITGPDELRSTQFVSSLLYSLPNAVSNALWIRPYVGAGVNVYRSRLSTFTPGGFDAIDRGVAYRIFGGAEFTWANVPQVALSADIQRQFAPGTPRGFEFGGFGLSLAAHWYVR